MHARASLPRRRPAGRTWLLALGLAAWLDPATGAAQLRPAPDPDGPDLAYVDVDAVVVHGAGGGTLGAAEVLDLDVELSRLAGGWAAARPGLPARRWRLRDLGRAGVRLYGSALDAVVDAVESAHLRRGHAGVGAAVRPGAVARAGTGQRSLVIELRRAGVPVAPLASLPASRDRFGRDAVLVTVRSLDLTGPADLALPLDELLTIDVDLAWDTGKIPAGYVAPRPGLSVQAVPLWQLGRFGPRGAQLYGSAIQSILQALGEALYARGVHGVIVDLEPGAIRRLATPGGDGLLLLRVVRP